MGKSRKEMCPFSYWKAREVKSEPIQEEHMYGKKGKRTCVLLAIREQERQIQNAQVLSISSKSRDKNKVICRSVSSIEPRA